MRNVVKKVLICLAVTVSIQVLTAEKLVFAQTTSGQVNTQNSVQQVTSSSSTNEVNQIAEKDNVSLGKIWTIRLTKPVDSYSVNGDTIKVVNKANGNVANVSLHIQKTDESCINIIPIDNYAPGSEYSIYISKNVKSKDGATLKKDVEMDFKTQYLPTAADDITASIMQFGDYTLPNQVDAKLPDGTIKKWDVNWDNAADTSIVGTNTFKGTLEGTDVSVNLTLTINPYWISSASNGTRNQSAIQIAHLNYLMASKANRDAVEDAAAKLNGNSETNTCVYFASESYRRVGYSIANWVCNTHQLTDKLSNDGWKKDYNKDHLLSGDQCFTNNDGTGYPNHTYTFVKWVNENDHTLAYIVDNQRSIFGDGLHKRDILIVDTDKFTAFQFFMYKPN